MHERRRTVNFTEIRERLAGRCFVCELVAGSPEFRHHVVYEDDAAIARHVHWHLAPLPPGVPFAQQQFAALDTDLCLDLSGDEFSDLARRIREALPPASWK
jgi:diadenosine tetraphosphate (Ap4A) HIT family hydrolase